MPCRLVICPYLCSCGCAQGSAGDVRNQAEARRPALRPCISQTLLREVAVCLFVHVDLVWLSNVTKNTYELPMFLSNGSIPI